MSARLDGKVAIITGAAQGIGRATAEAFAREGAAVAVADKDVEAGTRVSETFVHHGATAKFYEIDVADSLSCERVAEQVKSDFGKIDVLVANAGVNVFAEPLDISEQEWRRCFAVDLDGVWFSARAVLPHMILQRSGAIVAMASCHSFAVIPGCFPYPVAKHGVIGLVKALGVQYAAHGIRVNAIAPGYIETELTRRHWASFPFPEQERERICRLHPPGRIGRPEEVAMTAVFLASDEAPFINATSIQIDGGRSAVYHD